VKALERRTHRIVPDMSLNCSSRSEAYVDMAGYWDSSKLRRYVFGGDFLWRRGGEQVTHASMTCSEALREWTPLTMSMIR